MEDLFDIKDKVIVITGGGGVLCGTMARALGSAGAKIAVLDIIEAAAQKVTDQIKSNKGRATAIKCDVLDKKSLEAAREKINSELGRIDVLINGAGGNKKEATTSPDLSFFDLPSEAVRFVFDLNFIGTLLPTQVCGQSSGEQLHSMAGGARLPELFKRYSRQRNCTGLLSDRAKPVSLN